MWDEQQQQSTSSSNKKDVHLAPEHFSFLQGVMYKRKKNI